MEQPKLTIRPKKGRKLPKTLQCKDCYLAFGNVLTLTKHRAKYHPFVKEVEPEIKVVTKEPQLEVVNLGNERIGINGKSYIGKCRVTLDIAAGLRRMLQSRQEMYKKEKQYIDHGDRKFIIPGR